MASPLVGYNTNVRHHGKLFHIQTEDSGVSHGHIFTHLFADGGRIVATKKTTYAHHIGTEAFPGVVKKLMQAQHKAMFIALRDGLFDGDELEGARLFAAREIVLDDARPAETKADALRPSEPLERPGSPHEGPIVDAAVSSPGILAAPLPPATSDKSVRVFSRPPEPPSRYATTSPAKRSSVRPRESLFGQDLLGEKSLDEVIMSYLAEDLEKDS